MRALASQVSQASDATSSHLQSYAAALGAKEESRSSASNAFEAQQAQQSQQPFQSGSKHAATHIQAEDGEHQRLNHPRELRPRKPLQVGLRADQVSIDRLRTQEDVCLGG